MLYVLVFTVSTLGAFIQAVTGFGAAIFMMLFFPHFMPVTSAAALNGVACLASNVTNTVEYRKHVNYKLLPLPVAAFFLWSFLSIRLSKMLDTGLLKMIFGAVLLLLAVYFLFAAKKLKIRPTPASSLTCGSVSGVTGGMFGASGPPMVVYFLAATGTKEEYLGTLQSFCLLTGLWSFAVRLANGFYTVSMLPLLLLGVAGVLLGQWIGTRVVHKISVDGLRIAVYVMLAVSGVINLFF